MPDYAYILPLAGLTIALAAGWAWLVFGLSRRYIFGVGR